MTAIGTTQGQVLLCLHDDEDRTVARVAMDMGLTDSQARNAIERLYSRGLVTPARFDHGGREWTITTTGRAAIERLYPDLEDTDCA